jgi:DNA repair photolyase
MDSFDKERSGTGTREWSETSYNIQNGCKNGCLYCYACANALRFKRISNHQEWTEEKIRQKAVDRNWSKLNGTIMFPTTHDITEENINESITVLKKMLVVGNDVLIVSKPRLSCIKVLCRELSDYKSQIFFRFTIGSISCNICSFWEPGAPEPYERLQALKYAYENGFQTSVSMEPMLSGYTEAVNVFNAVKPYITDTIWIGKMNKIRSRVDLSIPINQDMVECIEFNQRYDAILRLVDTLKDEPKVRWKDSIKKIMSSL